MIGFKPVKGYEDLYSISSKGDVISMYNAITLKPCEKNGYLYVNLYKDKKASNFIGKRDSYVSERFRRTGKNKIVVDGKKVMINEWYSTVSASN